MTNDLNYLFKTKILVSLRDGKYLFFHQSEFCLPGGVLHNIKIFLEHWFFGYCVIWCRYLIYVWCINMYDNYICSSSLYSSMNTRHFNHLYCDFTRERNNEKRPSPDVSSLPSISLRCHTRVAGSVAPPSPARRCCICRLNKMLRDYKFPGTSFKLNCIRPSRAPTRDKEQVIYLSAKHQVIKERGCWQTKVSSRQFE